MQPSLENAVITVPRVQKNTQYIDSPGWACSASHHIQTVSAREAIERNKSSFLQAVV